MHRENGRRKKFSTWEKRRPPIQQKNIQGNLEENENVLKKAKESIQTQTRFLRIGLGYRSEGGVESNETKNFPNIENGKTKKSREGGD